MIAQRCIVCGGPIAPNPSYARNKNVAPFYHLMDSDDDGHEAKPSEAIDTQTVIRIALDRKDGK